LKLEEIAALAPLVPGITRGAVLGGCYRLIRPLAAGGCGEVFLAAHTRTNGRFAVKILRRDLGVDGEAAIRFSHEAEITATIRHPHVVQVFDFNITEAGVPFLVMELLEGELLSDRLARLGSLDPRSAVHIVDQIAHALGAAHARGIVHRDLKPDNVMLVAADGRDDFVKLLDFGISQASWRPELSQPHLITGTPEYMAPEQAAADPARIGPRTDQWALAAMAYEVLTGLEPFQGETALATLDQVVNGEPIVPSDLAPALDDRANAVILRGLSKDPADRYPDAVAFSAALREALEPDAAGPAESARHDAGARSPERAIVDGPLARPSRAVRTTVRLLRRRRWRRLLVPSVVIALAGLLATWRTPSGTARAGLRWTRAAIGFAVEHVAKLK
jgi:serine/threonine-protein kinase